MKRLATMLADAPSGRQGQAVTAAQERQEAVSKRLHAEAHRYLLQGYPVVAVTGKRPVVPWLAYVGRLPGEGELGSMCQRPEVTGLALVIGPALWQRHPGLWVLDVEARHRPAAEAWLDARLPDWRQGRVAESGSGGLHIYLRAATPPRTRPCAFGDVKGERSIVVLPPSLHPKGVYRWLSEGDPQPLDPDTVPAPPGRPSPAAPSYTALADADPIPEGQRHRVLISVGGLLRRAGLAAADLAATLHSVNRLRCKPPLPAAEVDRLAASLARYTPAPTPAGSGGAGDRPGAGGRMDVAAVDRLLQGLPADAPTPQPPQQPPRAEQRRLLPFLTVSELTKQVPADVPWLWRAHLARGAVTVLAGREKAGKSTFVWALVAALLRGEPFCGQPTERTGVVVLSEETDVALAQRLARLGLDERSPLALRPRTGLTLRPRWEEAVAAAAAEADRIKAGVVLVDTLSWWASLRPEAENDAGAMTWALRPLLELSQRGPAVLCVHHVTKGSGELRGSTAIGAMADIIVTLARDRQATNRRVVEVVGRFTGLTAEPQVVELGEDGRYRVVSAEERLGELPAQLLTLLPAEPPGLSVAELSAAGGASPRHVRRVLGGLVAQGLARRAPGRRRDTPRFVRCAAGEEADGAAESLATLFDL